MTASCHACNAHLSLGSSKAIWIQEDAHAAVHNEEVVGDVGLLQPHAHLCHKVCHVRQILATLKNQAPNRILCQLVDPHILKTAAAGVTRQRRSKCTLHCKRSLQIVALHQDSADDLELAHVGSMLTATGLATDSQIAMSNSGRATWTSAGYAKHASKSKGHCRVWQMSPRTPVPKMA